MQRATKNKTKKMWFSVYISTESLEKSWKNSRNFFVFFHGVIKKDSAIKITTQIFKSISFMITIHTIWDDNPSEI